MEKLYRVNFHSKFSGFKLFLLVWAVDVPDLIHRISPIMGAARNTSWMQFLPFCGMAKSRPGPSCEGRRHGC